jgi:hypothetical protein
MAIIVARPILDAQEQPIGILVGRTTPVPLTEIMLERAGLGETGETYLVTRSHIMLTEPRFPEPRWYNLYYVFTEGAKTSLEEHRNGSGIYTDYRGMRVLGVYHWLPELEVALLAEQNEAEAMAPTFASLAINIVVGRDRAARGDPLALPGAHDHHPAGRPGQDRHAGGGRRHPAGGRGWAAGRDRCAGGGV